MGESLTQKELDLMQKRRDLKATVEEEAQLQAYLLEIKPGCDFITTNIVARKANRATEAGALSTAAGLLRASPVFLHHEDLAYNASLGDCLSICYGMDTHANCKACLAKTSVPGYCAGHPATYGC